MNVHRRITRTLQCYFHLQHRLHYKLHSSFVLDEPISTIRWLSFRRFANNVLVKSNAVAWVKRNSIGRYTLGNYICAYKFVYTPSWRRHNDRQVKGNNYSITIASSWSVVTKKWQSIAGQSVFRKVFSAPRASIHLVNLETISKLDCYTGPTLVKTPVIDQHASL